MTDIVGVAEITEMAGVASPSVVSNWIRRSDDFPKPVADLAMGPIFNKKEVERWLKKKQK